LSPRILRRDDGRNCIPIKTRLRPAAGGTSGGIMKSELFSSLIEILTPVLVAGLTFLSAWLARLITAKVKGEYLRGVLVRLDEAVFTAVKSVAQTYADALKTAREDGKLEPAERQEAKRRALGALKSY